MQNSQNHQNHQNSQNPQKHQKHQKQQHSPNHKKHIIVAFVLVFIIVIIIIIILAASGQFSSKINTPPINTGGNTYIGYCGANSYGDDIPYGTIPIGTYTTSTATDCANSCNSTTGCGGFVYQSSSPDTPGICWLKNSSMEYSGPPNQPGISYVNTLNQATWLAPLTAAGGTSILPTCNTLQNEYVTTAPTPGYTRYCNSSAAGNDMQYGNIPIGQYISNNATDCATACSSTTGCNGFAYSGMSDFSGTCWLKNSNMVSTGAAPGGAAYVNSNNLNTFNASLAGTTLPTTPACV